MTNTLLRRLHRLAGCVLVAWTLCRATSHAAEVLISDAQHLNSPTERLDYITSIAFSLDDSCLVAVRRPRRFC